MKKQVGRPVKDEVKGKKSDYCKTINIAIDKEDLEVVKTFALVARNMDLTTYVNFLVQSDIEKNLGKYHKEVKRLAELNFE